MAQTKTTTSVEMAKHKPQAKRKTGAKHRSVTTRASSKRKTARKPEGNGIGPRKKRTINAVHLAGELARKFAEAPSRRATYDEILDEGFREELMVAVAFQNRAPYCNWAHRKWATLAGVSEEELAKVEQLDLDKLDPRVSTAVNYVRALVSSDWEGAPRELRQQVQTYFSWREIEDIERIAKGMDLSNRAANTWDAMLSRLQGKPVEDSDLPSEILSSYLFLSRAPKVLHKVSRRTGISKLDLAQNLVNHVQGFNRQHPGARCEIRGADG